MVLSKAVMTFLNTLIIKSIFILRKELLLQLAGYDSGVTGLLAWIKNILMLPEHQFPAAPAHSPEGIHPWLVQAPPIEENRPLGKKYYYIFDIFSRGAETL